LTFKKVFVYDLATPFANGAHGDHRDNRASRERRKGKRQAEGLTGQGETLIAAPSGLGSGHRRHARSVSSIAGVAKTAPATRAEAVFAHRGSERQRHLLRFGSTGTFGVGLRPEELDPPSYRVRRALRSVSGNPLPKHQSAADGDLASLRQVGGAGLGLASERGHLHVGRLALLTAAAGIVDGDSKLADRATLTADFNFAA